MRVLLQRVSEAAVRVEGEVVGQIGPGLLLLVGVESADGDTDIDWLVGKLLRLRIFGDEAGVMNRSVQEAGGDILAVSQFTLFGSTRKGNRPSWSRAAAPDFSRPMFERFVEKIQMGLGRPVPTGIFGADMKVSLINDGPVTLMFDSKQPE
ncbi:D-aminoacyl-tRNA deacylase [Parachitinimonas caeni]|uniref:D-aminoacyl-tRNA deacylase n=1 Tax=Parachitinimonas caeni TaxID=3031301 RepID=A0ABT7E1U7_9NEIS|nr:D-aminoacyl-tRNA deacylase [Parachitinimonas caeni]MDK2126292.1 D-aminoacyl-tRNA deacylase [Parachitinimonas caeni]